MDEDMSGLVSAESQKLLMEKQKAWIFYVSAICNRRTVHDMTCEMWRSDEQSWVHDIGRLLQQCADAKYVVDQWYVFHHSFFPLRNRATTHPRPRYEGIPIKDEDREDKENGKNSDLKLILKGRHLMSLERIWRPIIFLVVHYEFGPEYAWSEEILSLAQEAVDNCARLIPNYYFGFRHEWTWNVLRGTFGCALQVLAVVLYQIKTANRSTERRLQAPKNWAALIRLAIRTLRLWEKESLDILRMRSILQRMYEGACHLAAVSPDLPQS